MSKIVVVKPPPRQADAQPFMVQTLPPRWGNDPSPMLREIAEAALWVEALAAYEAIHGTAPSALRLASEGHRNARHIVQGALADVTGCPCGEEEPCPGVDTPERIRLRAALTALAGALGVPEVVERGLSPP